MTVDARLERVARQLARTPYEPGLVAEGALLGIASGRPYTHALQDLVRLGDRSLATVLGRIAESPDVLERLVDQVYILHPNPDRRAAVEAAISIFKERLPQEWCPAAVVEFSSQPAQPTFAHVPGPGFAYILVGVRDGIDDLGRAIAHEFAHAVFVSGQRFLDEGAAGWLETGGKGPHSQAATGLGLRQLLRHNAVSDPFLTGFDGLPPGAVHAHAAAFVGWLVRRVGVHGLRNLYDLVRDRPAGTDVDTVVETSIGMDLEEIDRLLSGSKVQIGSTSVRPAGVADRLVGAFIRMDHQAVEQIAETLADTDPLDQTDDPDALALWARIAVFRLLSSFWRGSSALSQEAEAETVLARLRRADPSHLSLPVLTALFEIGRLSTIDNELAGMTQIAIVQGLLEQARARAPDDVEIRYHQAVFTLMTPPAYVDGREEASESLRLLMEQQTYRDEIRGAVAALGGLHGMGRTIVPKTPAPPENLPVIDGRS